MYYESGIFPILFTEETRTNNSTDPVFVTESGEVPPPPPDPPKV